MVVMILSISLSTLTGKNHRINLPSLPHDTPWQLIINTEFDDKAFIKPQNRPKIYQQNTLNSRSVSVYNAII